MAGIAIMVANKVPKGTRFRRKCPVSSAGYALLCQNFKTFMRRLEPSPRLQTFHYSMDYETNCGHFVLDHTTHRAKGQRLGSKLPSGFAVDRRNRIG